MTRKGKIAIWVIGSILVIGALAFTCADVVVSRMVQRRVNKSLAELPIPGCTASCGNIHVFLFSGMADVYDLKFSYRGEPLSRRDTTRPGFDLTLDHLSVGHIFYTPLIARNLLVDAIRAEHPSIELWMDEKHPEKSFPEMHDDGMSKLQDALNRIALNELRVNNASMKFHSLRTKLDVAADSCTFAAYDFVYADSAFSYCDSLYKVQLGHIRLLTPDGLIRIETHDICQRDAGDLTLGQTRIAHTVAKLKLGDIMKEPTSWIDMTFESVRISAFNPIRKALAQDYSLDNIAVVIQQMDVFRDNRYKPTHSYPMPQELFVKLPVQLDIKSVDARLKKMVVELAETEKNIGKLTLANGKARITNITNRRGQTMRANATCPIEQGNVELNVGFTMNKTSDFTAKIHGANVDAQLINTLLRPIVGIEIGCMIDELDVKYSGNNVSSTGICRLMYHGLEVKVHKEDNIPFKIVTANADFINSAAKNLIPKSNPSKVDIHPRAYKVEAKRNEMLPFPMYFLFPLIDGAKKTFLPGLYVHEEVKKPVFD